MMQLQAKQKGKTTKFGEERSKVLQGGGLPSRAKAQGRD